MKNQETLSCIGTILMTLVLIASVIAFFLVNKNIDSSLLDAATMVCMGEVLTEAADFNDTLDLHPVVIVAMGHVSEKSALSNVSKISFYPNQWLPKSVSDIQLVACLAEKPVVIESCRYDVGPNVNRIRIDLEVVLRVAKTGERIASFTTPGESVPACPRKTYVEQTEVQGDGVGRPQLISALENWIDPQK
ncbi:MAG: hypothetical protein L0287_11310 [Anaerolineae bacterium]|nr:hypothetical protein [Anaerolineae bacterium]